MYAFRTHKIPSRLIFRPALMAGMATFTIVVSSMIMKKPVTRTTRTTHGFERFSTTTAENLIQAHSIPSTSIAKRLLVPGDIPVAAEFAALLGEMGDSLEAETLVQRDRGWVGQRDPGVGAMYVLVLERLEQLRIELRSGPVSHRARSQVDGGLHRRLVGRLRSEAAAAGEAHDLPLRDPDQ